MRVETSGAAGRATSAPPPRPVLVGVPTPDLHQESFLDLRDALLPGAGASGQRLVTALYLILRAHGPAVVDGRGRISCAECGAGGVAPGQEYPCPTAQQALWALDATLARPPGVVSPTP